MKRIGIAQINGVAVTVSVILVLVGALLSASMHRPSPFVLGALLGTYCLFAIKVVRQWEKVALLRLGKYVGLRGPGLFHIVPVIETLSPFVDQRVRVANVSAESTLTRDTVPVNVDAIVFWLVWNAEKAILEVENFFDAINLSAQTALRESIGRHELAQMITERETLGRELQRILDEKTNPWGITVQSVEVRDVRIPQGLEDAMSRQAQAERERQARIILGQAETEISDKFVQAAAAYREDPTALHLRAMNMLYEAIKERGSMVIVPSSAVETMGLGGSLATASLGSQFHLNRSKGAIHMKCLLKVCLVALMLTGSTVSAQAQRGHNMKLAARIQERTRNRRKDRNHKLSRRLVAENVAIYFSKDNNKGMAKKFGKSVASSGHAQLRSMLAYKSPISGTRYVEVDAKFSTMTCSACGYRTGPRGLSMLELRHWTCVECGSSHHRDINAAVNTLMAGAGSALENHADCTCMMSGIP